ncbi:MAG: serine/arginine repetitive matrix protein 2 [Clostridia bacterium]|nr:serine/arginine repetitive matrix protein 2 [Clostridia bacterium]
MPEKKRVSRHNGRAGKHGVYNPKHNDRNFDVANAENIDQARTQHNLYWDCRNGLRTHEEQMSGLYPTFNQHEHDEYERRYGDYIAGQHQRNKKSGHMKRNRTVDDLLKDKRFCPEETVYQIGKEGDCPPPEVLTAIVTEFFDTLEQKYGSHVHVLDWALHLDETSPHIHARQVFDITNRYGEVEPKQEKALEQLGIPLPYPNQKPGRDNHRKKTFDNICRELLLDICQAHGVEVEREAIYGGREYLEKNDYIIEKQKAMIEAQKAEIEAKDAALAEKEAELDAKLLRLEDVDTLLDEVTSECYDKAVEDVSKIVHEVTARQIDLRFENAIYAAGSDAPPTVRGTILQWLGKTKEDLFSALLSMAEDVRIRLMSPIRKDDTKFKITEAVRPAVVEKLKPKLHTGKRHAYER